MTEEAKVEETTEETPEAPEGLDAEEEGTPDAPEEGAVDEEKEEVNGRGVPYKNVAAEERRKREAAEARASEYKELLEKLNKPKEEQTPQELIESISDAEFEAAGITPSQAQLLRKSQYREAERAINKRVKQVEEEAQANAKHRQAYQQERIKALEAYAKESPGEFGSMVTIGSDGRVQFDMKSDLTKRANEIYTQRTDLHNRADGEVTAARMAELELTKAKYGKPKPKKKSSKAEHLKGSGGGTSGGGGAITDAQGNYHRDLSDEEFDKLPRVEKSKYNLQRTLAKVTKK